MNKKRTLLIAVGIISAIGAANISYARTIPGVDEPFDIANYYSPTSISYADSAPSPFAMRELSRGTVYDYTRHMKSILFGDDFNSIYQAVQNQLAKLILDMTGMDEKKSHIGAIESSLRTSEDIDVPSQEGIFRTSTSNNQVTQNEQFHWLDAHYGHRLEDIKSLEEDSNERMQAIEGIIKTSAEAEGNLEAIEAETEIISMQAAENIRRNAILSSMASIEAAHQSHEIDQALKDQEATKNGLTIKVVPQSPSDRDRALSPRPEAHGFYDFH